MLIRENSDTEYNDQPAALHSNRPAGWPDVSMNRVYRHEPHKFTLRTTFMQLKMGILKALLYATAYTAFVPKVPNIATCHSYKTLSDCYYIIHINI